MDYKKQAAVEAAKRIQKGQVIGLGAGNTIAHLVDELATHLWLTDTLQFVCSSTDTAERVVNAGLNLIDPDTVGSINQYFDGCDQLDNELNALKSGGGIHTDEKALARMADEFIILGDDSKLSEKLSPAVPFTVEVLPASITAITKLVKQRFDTKDITVRKSDGGGNVKTIRGCVLLDVRFNKLPHLDLLNEIKMWPGIIDHSLFYKLVTAAIICGPNGTHCLIAEKT